MTVRVKLSVDRSEETLKELTAYAGFDPKPRDRWLVWEFRSRDTGDLFYANARNTNGVSSAEIGDHGV